MREPGFDKGVDAVHLCVSLADACVRTSGFVIIGSAICELDLWRYINDGKFDSVAYGNTVAVLQAVERAVENYQRAGGLGKHGQMMYFQFCSDKGRNGASTAEFKLSEFALPEVTVPTATPPTTKSKIARRRAAATT